MKLLVTILCVAALYSQPAGNAPFGGLVPDASSRKPVGACKELRSLTALELSVIGATVIPASATAPEHCRVSLMAQPEVNIEVNLPSAWNGRLYMLAMADGREKRSTRQGARLAVRKG